MSVNNEHSFVGTIGDAGGGEPHSLPEMEGEAGATASPWLTVCFPMDLRSSYRGELHERARFVWMTTTTRRCRRGTGGPRVYRKYSRLFSVEPLTTPQSNYYFVWMTTKERDCKTGDRSSIFIHAALAVEEPLTR